MKTAEFVKQLKEYRQTDSYTLQKKYGEVSTMLSVIRHLSTVSIDMPDVFSDEWCELHGSIDRAEKHVAGILDGLIIAQEICASGYGYSLGMYYYIDSKRREWELAKAKCQKPKVENDCQAEKSRRVA